MNCLGAIGLALQNGSQWVYLRPEQNIQTWRMGGSNKIDAILHFSATVFQIFLPLSK